mgnify:CR=1 FL=1
MRILFIDTSGTDVSISIISDNKVLVNINEKVPNSHSIYTVSFIDKALKAANLSANDIEKILVVAGPGSFTGVRIGVTIAKVYAYLRKIEVIPVSSLKMLSLSTNHDYCLALINAKNNNYYLGLYNKDNEEVIKEQFNNKDMVLDIINKYNPTIVSDNDLVIDDVVIKKQKLDIRNICSYYQNKTAINTHLIVPNYLKLPSAMEDKKWLER